MSFFKAIILGFIIAIFQPMPAQTQENQRLSEYEKNVIRNRAESPEYQQGRVRYQYIDDNKFEAFQKEYGSEKFKKTIRIGGVQTQRQKRLKENEADQDTIFLDIIELPKEDRVEKVKSYIEIKERRKIIFDKNLPLEKRDVKLGNNNLDAQDYFPDIESVILFQNQEIRK